MHNSAGHLDIRETLDGAEFVALLLDDVSFRVMDASRGTCAMLGYSIELIRECSLFDLAPALNNREFAKLLKPLHHGTAKSVTLRASFVRAGGGRFPALCRIEHVTAADGACAYSLIALPSDAENPGLKLAELMDLVPNMIYARDIYGHYLLANRATAEAHGTTTEQLLRGVFTPTHRPAEEVAAALAADLAVIESGKPRVNNEEVFTDARGRRRVLQAVRLPYRPSGANHPAVLVVTIDITERRDAEHFASMASHDLQEPLSKVQAIGEMLRRTTGGTLDEKSSGYVAAMTDTTRQMQELIRDLLDYSRLNYHGRPAAEVDVSLVVMEVVAAFELRVAETRAQIHIDPLPVVRADAGQMRQLFQNLFSNALKYRREGVAPEIRVTVEKTKDRLIVTVSDNGIGFEPRYAEQIFEAFQRLHNRAEFEGTGLGLTICRRIVERHGGRIRAEGSTGKGARFVMEFPASMVV